MNLIIYWSAVTVKDSMKDRGGLYSISDVDALTNQCNEYECCTKKKK